MKTYLDCVPCFFKQAQDAARLAGAKSAVQKKILNALSQEILKFNLKACPTEMGRILYALVIKMTGEKDPFKEIKQRSNKMALAFYPRLKDKVKNSKDKLLTAIELAIAGNVIDYGVKFSLNIAKEIEKIFAEEDRIIRKEGKAIFDGSSSCFDFAQHPSKHPEPVEGLTINPERSRRVDYPTFKQALKKTKKILYLGDNAGEVVFDRVLIEELKDKEIIYAVRGKPIINDALVEDAIICGIDKCAQIISTGCDAPGTILKFCTKRFLKIYRDAELIISKGQGNFEALADERRLIFFLFRAKCPVVAKHLRCKVGDVILTRT